MRVYSVHLKHESASVTLRVWQDNEAIVTNLYSAVPRSGHVTELMKKVVKFADDEGLTLVLVARQFGHTRGLDNQGLRKFYEKFDFVLDRDELRKHSTLLMLRDPQKKVTP